MQSDSLNALRELKGSPLPNGLQKDLQRYLNIDEQLDMKMSSLADAFHHKHLHVPLGVSAEARHLFPAVTQAEWQTYDAIHQLSSESIDLEDNMLKGYETNAEVLSCLMDNLPTSADVRSRVAELITDLKEKEGDEVQVAGLASYKQQVLHYVEEIRAEYPDASVTVHASLDHDRNKIMVEIRVLTKAAANEDDTPATPNALDSTADDKPKQSIFKGLLNGLMDIVVTVKKAVAPAPAPATPKEFAHFQEAFDYVRVNTDKPCVIKAWRYLSGAQITVEFTMMRFYDQDKKSCYKITAKRIANDGQQHPIVLKPPGDRGAVIYSHTTAQALVKPWVTA